MNIHIKNSVKGDLRGEVTEHLKQDGHNPDSIIRDADFIIGMLDDDWSITKRNMRIALSVKPPEMKQYGAFLAIIHTSKLSVYGDERGTTLSDFIKEAGVKLEPVS